jgi:LCP family protein required for cell wall assembly
VLANLAAIAFIWAVQTGNTLLGGADTDDEVTEVLDPASGDDLTFLVVGSDSREGLDDLTHFGAAGGARGDVVMLVRIAGNGSAQMLSVPRDYYVDIPGHGKNKINAAYSLGGPALMVETIKSNFDLRINHYVEIDFVGFQAMVDELGGIDIAFPFAARDLKSGLAVDAGAETLDGFQALAYARSRSYQELQNGSWVSVKANDFGRTERQQEVIRAMLSKLKRPGSITEAGDIASAMGRHMTIDTKLANASVASFIWDYRGILAGSIEGATLPGDIRTISGSSVVVAREPDASAMLANFRAGRPFASQPLRIEVLNGNGQTGAAGDMSRTLESYGFLVEAIGNAEDTYAETTVIVPEGSESGSVITAALGFGVVRFGSVDNGYDAVVIVGSDVS